MTEYAVHAQMVLDDAQTLCLREAEGQPLSFQQRWVGEGEKRCRCAFGRLGGSWHDFAVIVRLAELGLVQVRGALIVPTPAGHAWLAAHPPPESWRSS